MEPVSAEEEAQEERDALRDILALPRSVVVARMLAINVDDATKLCDEYGVHPDKFDAYEIGVDENALTDTPEPRPDVGE